MTVMLGKCGMVNCYISRSVLQTTAGLNTQNGLVNCYTAIRPFVTLDKSQPIRPCKQNNPLHRRIFLSHHVVVESFPVNSIFIAK
ncbi:Uncharacterized protein HZ326_19366 [Fusarium oxysporum f. sp. albedinis]|nr:Uncharacterized protein HZ326_19366 [Fusarium oxysporum f. sp. albedinis]